jgi:hypothetical protein
MDEDYAGIVVRQLYNHSDSVPLVVFGMPTWGNFETVRLDYLTAIHCMITAANWCNKKSAAYKNFEQNFIATYHSRPLERNITGYDQMMMAVKLLSADSGDIGKNVVNLTYHGLSEDFNFMPYYNNYLQTDNPDFFENADVHVLQFKDNSLVKRF